MVAEEEEEILGKVKSPELRPRPSHDGVHAYAQAEQNSSTAIQMAAACSACARRQPVGNEAAATDWAKMGEAADSAAGKGGLQRRPPKG